MNLPSVCSLKPALRRPLSLPVTGTQLIAAGKVFEVAGGLLIKIGTAGKTIGQVLQRVGQRMPK